MTDTFRSLLEAAADGILVVDRSGRVVLANAQCAKLFGHAPAALIGQPIEQVVPAYIRAQHVGMRDGYFANPHTRPMGVGLPLVAERKDGTWAPVEISLSPFEFAGEPCAIAIVRDVTEARRLDRELKRSNAELEQFASVASHDLQEPLRVVSGYTQLLKRRYADRLDKDAVEYIDYAVDGVKRMQILINDLLSYSRLSSRAKPFEPVAVLGVVRQAIANLKASLDESSGRVTLGALPETIHADRTQLVQVFQNLIGNALKFRRPEAPPEVVVSAARLALAWEFRVEDNGIGIEPAYAGKIFVIFQRLHTRDKYPGTGLGLAICKKIVERHGGTITCASHKTGQGVGTTFLFSIPDQEVRHEHR